MLGVGFFGIMRDFLPPKNKKKNNTGRERTRKLSRKNGIVQNLKWLNGPVVFQWGQCKGEFEQRSNEPQPILPVMKPGENVPMHFFYNSWRETLEISAYLHVALLIDVI